MTTLQLILALASGSVWTLVVQMLWRFVNSPRPIKIDDDEPPAGIGA